MANSIDKRLLALYLINFFINSSNSVIAPFFPDVAISKGLTEDLIGLIFSINQVGGCIFSLIFGKMMKTWGRRTLFILAIFTFGVMIHIPTRWVFITVGFCSRFLQGIGRAAFSSIAYAYLPILYPDSVEHKISLMEAFTGLGLMIGPLLGTALFAINGYQLPFYVYASFFIIIGPIAFKQLPTDEYCNEIMKNNSHNKLQVYKMIFSRRILLTAALLSFGISGSFFIMPVFANHLHTYGLGSIMVGVIFALPTIAYILSMPLITRLPKRIDKKVWLNLGLFLVAFSFFFLGPDKYCPLPKKLWVVIIGLVILGVGSALTMVPSMPEIIIQGGKISNDKQSVGDMASGIFNAGFMVSGIIGPNFGGNFTTQFGFAAGAGYYGLCLLGILLIYFLFCDGVLAFATICTKIEKKQEKNGNLIEKENDDNGLNEQFIKKESEDNAIKENFINNKNNFEKENGV